MTPTIASQARHLLRFLARRGQAISPLLILTHDYPDPDALASAFALYHLAEKVCGISARIAYGGVIGRMENRAMTSILKMPLHKLRPTDFAKYDHIALIDTQPAFQNNPFPKNRKATLVIDQHVSLDKPLAELALIDNTCGATSVILAEALFHLHAPIPVRVATALVYGILTDTMNLYRANRPELIRIYLRLLQNCDLKALAEIQNPTRSRRFFTTLGKGIRNAAVRRGLIFAHLGAVENPDLVSQVADFLLSYRRISWSMCTGRFKGKLHISLRTEKTSMQAGEILRDILENRGQAGGYSTVAGGSFRVGEAAPEETWKETEDSVTTRLFKRLRIPVTGDLHYPFRQELLKQDGPKTGPPAS
jgi:nanoRNase/pAp phosphatase (c-di-AMP/oligoRNAs hydrolase)